MRELEPFPVAVMIRPQTGGFVHQTDHILEQIDTILALRLPNIQIVTGALTDDDSRLDLVAMTAIRDRVKGTSLTCHRCFDLTPNPLVALEQLIDLGFDRVLTSGQAQTAPEGADVIAQLVEQAKGRIEIIAGAGIRPHNVQQLIRRTGVTQVHASCFVDPEPVTSKTNYGPTLRVSAEKVKALKESAIGSPLSQF
jgi:copper homeostasis protein